MHPTMKPSPVQKSRLIVRAFVVLVLLSAAEIVRPAKAATFRHLNTTKDSISSSDDANDLNALNRAEKNQITRGVDNVTDVSNGEHNSVHLRNVLCSEYEQSLKECVLSPSLKCPPNIVAAVDCAVKLQGKEATGKLSADTVKLRSSSLKSPDITRESRNSLPVLQRKKRIIGGNTNWVHWQVFIDITCEHTTSHCGGSILNSQWVLTAAHCICEEGYQDIQVIAGRYNLSDDNQGRKYTVDIQRVLRYPENIHGHSPDFALLKLTQPIQFQGISDYPVEPIRLPSEDLTTRTSLMCHISGWGLTERDNNRSNSAVLRVADIPMPIKCTDDEISLCSSFGDSGNDACAGDSGGPLYCPVQDGSSNDQFALVGVITHRDTEMCGTSNGLTRHLDVYRYKDWIEAAIHEQM